MVECDDFSISFNILSTRLGAEAVRNGVRCTALTLHKADWPVTLFPVLEGITVVVVVACTKHTVVSSRNLDRRSTRFIS